MTDDRTNDSLGGAGSGGGGNGPSPAEVTTIAGMSRKLRWLLISSLGVNLLVLGIVGGAILRHDRDGGRGMVADVGFGQFTEALNGDDRRALRDAFIKKSPNFRDMRSEVRTDLTTLITALRADSWDPEAVRSALAKQRDRTVERIALGQDLLLGRIAAMTPEARRDFADRLEGMMRRPMRDKN